MRRNLPKLSTGCESHFENLTNFKILKEPFLVLKQTNVAISGGRVDDLPQKNFFYHMRTYHFCGNCLFPKGLDQELSADVLFVSVLATDLPEY